MTMLTFKVNANPPAPQGPEITLVKQQNPDLPEDVIDFGGPIIATGEDLQMGEGERSRSNSTGTANLSQCSTSFSQSCRYRRRYRSPTKRTLRAVRTATGGGRTCCLPSPSAANP